MDFFFFFSGKFEKNGKFCWTFETKKLKNKIKILVATWANHYGQPIKHIHFL
jgi:hypothetical protein